MGGKVRRSFERRSHCAPLLQSKHHINLANSLCNQSLSFPTHKRWLTKPVEEWKTSYYHALRKIIFLRVVAFSQGNCNCVRAGNLIICVITCVCVVHCIQLFSHMTTSRCLCVPFFEFTCWQFACVWCEGDHLQIHVRVIPSCARYPFRRVSDVPCVRGRCVITLQWVCAPCVCPLPDHLLIRV